MLNRITMTGRLVADPELRTTQSASPVSVTSFRIANDRNIKNAEGERESDFFNVVAWRNKAEFICQYFSKGSLITVDGRLQTKNYTDKKGVQRIITEIVANEVYFGGSKKDDNSSSVPKSAKKMSSDNSYPSDFTPNFEPTNSDFQEIFTGEEDFPNY